MIRNDKIFEYSMPAVSLRYKNIIIKNDEVDNIVKAL